MVNKVRKKDGSMKYPYQVVMPFDQCIKFIDEIRKLPSIKYIYRDNKSYGTYVWGSSKYDVDFTEIFEVCKKYIPDFKKEDENGVYQRNYHGEYVSFSMYVAFTEFDKEV